MSKLLLQILDKSLLPALVVVVGKFLGVVFSLKTLGVDSNIQGYLTNYLDLVNSVPNGIKLITTYSDIFMFGFVTAFFTFLLLKSVILKNKLAIGADTAVSNIDLLDRIKLSYEVYTEATVTLFFVWLVAFIILIDAIFGKSYLWISIVTLVSTFVLTIIFFQDVIREVNNYIKNSRE